jgi:hypothetical protein
MALEIMLHGCDILLARVVCFLVITVITGSHCNASGVPLLPLPVTLGAFSSILDISFGWCCFAAAVDCFCVAKMKTAPTASR